MHKYIFLKRPWSCCIRLLIGIAGGRQFALDSDYLGGSPLDSCRKTSNSIVRLTFDTVAEAFREGATAEEIAQQYPGLALADVYSVLGYLLRHEAEVTAYLTKRAEQRQTTRVQNEGRFDPEGIRTRLLARRA
jgi:hypothetical protein